MRRPLLKMSQSRLVRPCSVPLVVWATMACSHSLSLYLLLFSGIYSHASMFIYRVLCFGYQSRCIIPNMLCGSQCLPESYVGFHQKTIFIFKVVICQKIISPWSISTMTTRAIFVICVNILSIILLFLLIKIILQKVHVN